jgi:hypothetical protein
MEKNLRYQIAKFLISNEPAEVDWNWKYADFILTLFKEYVKGIEHPYSNNDYDAEYREGFMEAISKVMEGLQ